ncbi:DMT family transporter [Paracoccaceae bacterium]|nr:DMT family transporter [Paracoccaceae bacterium]
MLLRNKRPLIGITFSIVSVFLGLASGLLIKKVSIEANLITTLFYRFVFSVPLLLLFAVYARGWSAFKISQKKTMAFRTIFGFSGMVLWMLAIRNLPLGQATALFQSSVIFVTLLSPFLLKENVGFFRWSSVILGLVGIIILTDPFSEKVSFNVIYGILAAVAGALLSITLRRLGKGDHSISVALVYNALAALVMLCVVFISPSSYHIEGNGVWMDLILLGIVTSVSQFFFTGAYHYVDAVVVSSMRYIQVPLAGFFGYLLFSEIMTLSEILGALIVISSCLIIGWRELVNQKD